MNPNRNVLRPTHNRLALHDVSTAKAPSINKTKFCNNASLQQQENIVPISNSRPILTAARSIKKLVNNQNDEPQMHISPMVSSIHRANIIHLQKTNILDENKTREQLEEELFQLPEYRQSIFDHLKSVEHLYAPKFNFMEHQSEINSAMRSILVDWLIEVADEYKLNDDTLFLCVQYVDRFLSTVNVTRSKLQLLGTTCMYVAAKYEEMYPPALEEFSFITDNTYETNHILRMEQIVMKMLNFSLSGPTSYTFMQYYLVHLKATELDIDDEHKCLSMLSSYLCTLALLQDRPFSSYRSSLLAASCLLYAGQLMNLRSIWNHRYVQMTSYSQADLRECVLSLSDLHSKTYHQDEATSSVLRRYLKMKKDDGKYFSRVKKIIHHSQITDENEELELTFDELDGEPKKFTEHR